MNNIDDLKENKNLYKFLEERTEDNKPNEKYIDIATNKIGLNKVTDINLSQGTLFLLKEFNKINEYSNINNYEHYTFGWSGLPCSREANTESKNLYDSILRLIKEKKNNNIKIILIGSSFGGNICLGISEHLTKEMYIPIEYIFTIGCPFFESAKNSIETRLFNSNEYLFKNVLNIKSFGDFIQKYGSKIVKNKNSTIINSIRTGYNDLNFYFEKKDTKKEDRNKKKENINKFNKWPIITAFFRNIISKNFYYPSHNELSFFNNKNIPVTILIPLIIKSNNEESFDNKTQTDMTFNLKTNLLSFSGYNSIQLPDNFMNTYHQEAFNINNQYYKK